jgi:nucleosome binding factor SPN SPT16 subunit
MANIQQAGSTRMISPAQEFALSLQSYRAADFEDMLTCSDDEDFDEDEDEVSEVEQLDDAEDLEDEEEEE